MPYCHTLDDDPPSVYVIQTISSLVGAGRGELRPLHSVIDPERLDNVVRSENERSVSFEYEGFHVTVHSDGTVLLRNPESIHTKLKGASNVLLVAPRGDDTDLCTDLCLPYPLNQENILNVTVDRTIDEMVKEWNSRDQGKPAEHKIISLSAFRQSEETQTASLSDSIGADLIDDIQDLTTFYKRIKQSLTELQSNPYTTVLCFHSIDALLAQMDRDTMYRFIHMLLSQIADSDAIAHCHLNPLTCDDAVMNILSPLFDVVVFEDGKHTSYLSY